MNRTIRNEAIARLALAAALVIGAGACGADRDDAHAGRDAAGNSIPGVDPGHSDETDRTATTTGPTSGQPGPMTGTTAGASGIAEGGTGAVADASGGTAAGSLGNGEVMGVLFAVNQAEMQAGQDAVQKGKSRDVRRFAQQLIVDHSTANEQVKAAGAGASPQEGDLMRTLQQQAQQDRAQLAGLSGSAYDRAFLASQVKLHQQVLQTIDQQLLPAATGTLRPAVESVRTHVAHHLAEAQKIQGQLGNG